MICRGFVLLNHFVEFVKICSVGVHLVIDANPAHLLIALREHGLSAAMRRMTRDKLHVDLIVNRSQLQIDSLDNMLNLSLL